jgi:hypothetical protein
MRLLTALAAASFAALVLTLAGPADAAWTGGGSGQSASLSMVMPTGSKPAASVSGSDVSLRWAAALLPGGSAVAGYLIRRYDINGNAVTVLASCAGTITTTTCTEHNVPAGTWTYTDTPLQNNWTGAASPTSTAVVVGG